ncbi:hypothetical protein SAMN05421812_108298 [Asanoa hainanensis]|uniref:Uncharacterized protein n=1 Tax=Asanoa hainanensis TaxID=560556 RepID=A0A239NFK4_9ACTN|nr:hypothetical protein [Asanoa hainanensis]SNT53747.1 hypothetical protein SAMN05421812_108298 [Asanoa hainanensis]
MMWQPPGHVPGVHAPGTTVPIPWIIEQQMLAARAQQAAAAAARAEEFRAAAEAMAAEGVLCGEPSCGARAVGRCSRCGQGFCASHNSVDRTTGDLAFWARPELCGSCQDGDIAAEEQRQREARAEAVARLHRARQAEQEHADRVTRNEARTNPAYVRRRSDWLDARISTSFRARTVSDTRAGVAVASLVAVPVLVLVLVGWLASGDQLAAVAIVCLALPLLWWLGWALYTLHRSRRQLRRAEFVEERRRLRLRLGCGAADCERCYA